MKNPTFTPYNRYRKTLAWIGFIVLYVVSPVFISVFIYRLAATRAATPSCYASSDLADLSAASLGALHGAE